MKRKKALAERIAQLEAGENPSQAEWAELFPDTPDDDGRASECRLDRRREVAA